MRLVRSALALSLIVAAPVQAAEEIELRLGGKLRHFFYVADQDNAPGEDINAAGMFTNAEVYFDGRTVLDNGIQIRATIELEAEARNDRNADEAYITFVTGFGNLRLGEKEGVNHGIMNAPIPQAFLTNEEEVLGLALARRTGITMLDAFTFKRFVDDALGVSYETPEIAGFRLGATYHPSANDREGVIDGAQQPHDVFDVSGGYEGRYPGGTYRVAGGYFHSNSRTGGNDGEEAWNAMLGLTYGGWELGTSYIKSMPANGREEKTWGVGALYGIGPIRISADFASARRDGAAGAPQKEQVDRVTLQTGYRLGPGIVVGLTGFYADQETDTGLNYTGGGVLGGVSLGF